MKLLAAILGFGLLIASVGVADAGKLTMTNAIREQTADTVTFDVTRSQPYDKKVVWVFNECHDAAGQEVVHTYVPVLWGTTESLTGVTWSLETGGVACEAYVTEVYGRDFGEIEYTP